MILTCPRCATRYLADPLLVWATGRIVQCEACGQRWRAVGEGVRPTPAPEPPPPVEPSPEDAVDPVAAGSAEPAAAVDEPPTAAPVETIETVLRPEPEPEAGSAVAEPRLDGHAAPAPELAAAPEEEEPMLTREYLFRKPPPPTTPSFGSSVSGAGPWLAIAFLVLIALAAFVMFRDVIVHALPGLAPMYAAMGLLVHPAAVPHG